MNHVSYFSVFPGELLRESANRERSKKFDNGCCEEGKHDLVVAGDRKTPAPSLGGPTNNVRVRSVMLNEVHVDGREVLERMTKVPDQGDGLEKYLWKEHRRAEVDIYTALEL
jgi:hypothetical protein